jgi:hypothetical protein
MEEEQGYFIRMVSIQNNLDSKVCVKNMLVIDWEVLEEGTWNAVMGKIGNQAFLRGN